MAFNWGIKEFKTAFFDSGKVQKALDAGTRKVLSKFGAFVRQRAKSSIRKRKASSQPGQPPSSHEGSLKRLIFFAYDVNRQSVVIGPVKFKKGEAPRLLEFGGTITRKTKAGASKSYTYRPRPFMGPAGMAELPKFRALLRNAV